MTQEETHNGLLPQSPAALQTAIKGCSLKSVATGTHQLTKQQHLIGLIDDPGGWMQGATPEMCYKGIQTASALNADRQRTKLLLFTELVKMWRSVRVGVEKTWQNDTDLQTAVDDILEMCPTMKIEEILYVFGTIRRGQVKLYGRLDTPTILEALMKHDIEITTPLREAEHTARKHEEWVNRDVTMVDWLREKWQ